MVARDLVADTFFIWLNSALNEVALVFQCIREMPHQVLDARRVFEVRMGEDPEILCL